jgi:hypothetical protein
MSNWLVRTGGDDNNAGTDSGLTQRMMGAWIGSDTGSDHWIVAKAAAYALLSGFSDADATSYVTASVKMRAGRLYFLSIANSAASAAAVASITGGGTWTSQATSQYNGTADRLSLWSCVPGADYTGTLTISFGASTETSCIWNISEVAGADTSTNDGIVQSSVATGNSTAPNAVLAGVDSNNSMFSACGHAGSDVPNAGSGWARLDSAAATTPVHGLATEMRVQPWITTNWSITSSQWGCITVEVKRAGTGPFVAGDVGKGVHIYTATGGHYRRSITAYTDSNTVTVDGAAFGNVNDAAAWIGGALATIGTAMTQASLVAGDTIWVGAGTYRISAVIYPTSMASTTYLYGDTDGAKTGDAGEVVLTAYAVNDTTAPANIGVLSFASANNWTCRGIAFIGGTQHVIAILGTTVNPTFQDCTIIPSGQTSYHGINVYSLTWGTVLGLTVERCRIFAATGNGINIACPANGSGVDYSLAVTIRNNVILAPSGYPVNITGAANTAKSGGITIANNLLMDGGGGVDVRVSTASGTSTTYPVSVYNNILLGGGISAATAGQIVSDYNVIAYSTAFTNVTQGANDVIDGSRMWRFSLGHEASYGGVTRPFGMFPTGSPLLGWGTSGSVTVTDDIQGITRPASGNASTAKALGPFERSNSATRQTGQYHSTPGCPQIAGPGYQDFYLPVDAVQTSVSAYLRRNSTYTGANPSLQVREGGECGVADASSSMVGAADTWEQVTVTFTPTSKGIVKIRFLSSDTNGGGIAYIDDLSTAWV